MPTHIKLDDIDLKILHELLQDGRKSFADIAKDCGTTKGVIARRFKRMEEKEIIVGATIQNSIACYNKNLIAHISLVSEVGKKDMVLLALEKFPQVVQVFHQVSEPFITLIAVVDNSEEFQSVRQQLLSLPHVNSVESSFYLGTRNHPENLSVFGDSNGLKESRTPLNSNIDAVDKQIIEKLATNGRITFSELAKQLGLAVETVSHRYEKLVNNGDIRAVIRIDPRKIGYPAFALGFLKFVKANRCILDALSKIQDVTQIQRTSGAYDFSTIIMLRDRRTSH